MGWLNDMLGSGSGTPVMAQPTMPSSVGLLGQTVDPEKEKWNKIGQMLLSVGSGLAQGNARGLRFGDSLGLAAQNWQQQQQTMQEKQLRDLLLGSQLQTAQQKMQARQQLQELFKNSPNGTPTPEMLWKVIGTNPDLLPQLAPMIQSLTDRQNVTDANREIFGGTPGAPVPGAPGVGVLGNGPVAPYNLPNNWQGMYGGAFVNAEKKYNLPPMLLAKQGGVESGFDPSIVSPKGATGVMQFMPGTARDFGIDPTNPVQSIDAAGKYMQQMLTKYGGDQVRALMAYNWGPGNVDSWTASGSDPSKVPTETRQYVQKILGGNPFGGNRVAIAPQPASGPQIAQGGNQPVLPQQLGQTPLVTPQGQIPPQGQPQQAYPPQVQAAFDAMRQQASQYRAYAQSFANHNLPTQANAYLQKAMEVEKTLAEQQVQYNKPLVNINNAGETESQKIAAQNANKFYSGLQDAASNVPKQQAQWDQMNALLEGIQTGKFSNFMAETSKTLRGLGIDPASLGLTDTSSRADAVNALSNKMALDARTAGGGNNMPGQMSDADRRFLVQMVPGLETTPEGRKLMTDFNRRMNDFVVGQARAVDDFVQKNGGAPNSKIYEIARKYAEDHPIFSQADVDAVLKAQQSAQGQPGQAPPAGQAPTTPVPPAANPLIKKYNLEP